MVAFLAAKDGGTTGDQNEINLKTNQLRRKLRWTVKLLLGKPVLDGNIFSLNPSKLA